MLAYLKNFLSRSPVRRHAVGAVLAATLLTVVAATGISRASAEEFHVIPAFAASTPVATGVSREVAVIAGGCFWGMQGVLQHVKGITDAVSGYAGGKQAAATYEAIGTGTTGHAEAVRITFDPRQISYARILQIYFSVGHNPTELNRQGPDSGTQYRSTVFPENAEQARIAKAYIAQLDKARVFGAPIATTIETARKFYPAEDAHQDYMVLNPNNPYIVINDLPKVDALKRIFPDQYRPDPVLVSALRTK